MSRTPHRDLPISLQRLSWLTLGASLLAMVLVLVVEGYELITAPWFHKFTTLAWLVAVGSLVPMLMT